MPKTRTQKREHSPKGAENQEEDFFCKLCRAEVGADCVKEFRFHPTRRWRFDYALPLHRIAVEVEGGIWTQGRHTRPAGFIGDIEKYNTATAMGWRVLRCTPSTLHGSRTLDFIRETINNTQTANGKKN